MLTSRLPSFHHSQCPHVLVSSIAFKYVIGLILILVVLSGVPPAKAQLFDGLNDYVATVRHGTFQAFPGRPIGLAVDQAFSGTTWEHFVAQSGEHVVEVNGFITQRLRLNAVDMAADTFRSELREGGPDFLLLMVTQAMVSPDFNAAFEEIDPTVPCSQLSDCSFDQKVEWVAKSFAAFQFNRDGQWRVGDRATLQFLIGPDGESFELVVADSPSFQGLGVYEAIVAMYAGSKLIR